MSLLVEKKTIEKIDFLTCRLCRRVEKFPGLTPQCSTWKIYDDDDLTFACVVVNGYIFPHYTRFFTSHSLFLFPTFLNAKKSIVIFFCFTIDWDCSIHRTIYFLLENQHNSRKFECWAIKYSQVSSSNTIECANNCGSRGRGKLLIRDIESEILWNIFIWLYNNCAKQIVWGV
jgi:hypothetical protein